jgi:hypothetical protein
MDVHPSRPAPGEASMNHNRVVTPYTNPKCWLPDEKALFDKGLCSWMLAGSPEYCREPSKPGASFGHCTKHEQEHLKTQYPDGTLRRWWRR